MSEIKKLSDLTGNPFDDLSAHEQADVIFCASAKTCWTWRNIAENESHPWWSSKRKYTGQSLSIGRFCANKVRLWDVEHAKP